MSSKNIEFKATLNTAEMDSKIQQLQQKLRTMSSSTTVGDKARSIYGEGAPMTERSQKLQESFNQRNLQALRQEFDVRERLFKSQENNLKQTDMQIDKAKKNSKEQLDLIKERYAIEEKMLRLNIEQNAIAEKAKSMGGKDQDFGGGGGQPPSAGAPTGKTPSPDKPFVDSIIKAIGVQQLAGMLARGIQGSANAVSSTFFEYAQDKTRQEAQIAKSAYQASGAGAVMSGRGIELGYYSNERMKAMRNAQDAMGGAGIREAGGILGNAVVGAATGAGLASIGGPLTAAGGAVVGGALGAAKGISASAIGSGVKSFFAEGNFSGYERERQAEYFRNMESNIEAEKAKNPFKQVALERLESMRPAMIQSGQLTGMGGNALLNQMQGGGLFTTQQKLGAIGELSGAGASTYQTRNYEQALDLKRGYGIQNAGGILGTLSGQTSGAGSDESVKKMLSDAFSRGFDASKFSRETEKFLAISTKFVVESGARSPEAMQKIAGEMGAFVTGTSMADLQSAATGREKFEQMTGSGGSQYSKALRMSAMRTSLPGLDESQLSYLNNMSADQIKAGGPLLEAMAEKAGIDLKTLQEKVAGSGGSQEFGLTYSATQQERLTRIQSKRKEIEKEKDPAKKKIMEQEFLRSRDVMEQVTSSASSGLGTGEQYSDLSLVTGQSNIGVKRDLSKKMPGQAQDMFTEAEKSEARSNQIEVKMIKEYTGEYARSAKDMVEASDEIVIALTKLSSALKFGDEEQKKAAVENAVRATAKANNVKPSTSGSW